GEVPPQLRVSRHVVAVGVDSPIAPALPGELKERPVLPVEQLGDDDRTADGGPELVLLEIGRLGSRGIGVRVPRIEGLVAHELPGRAANPVGTAFRHDVDDAAEDAAALGLVVVRLYLVLL